MKKDKIHYSFRKADSYNKQLVFSISPRCLGKSTALYNKIYKHFYEDHKPSILIRRQIVDITQAYIDSIQDVINKFLPKKKQIKFSYKLGSIKEGIIDIYIEDRLFIKIAALSNPKSRIKSLYIKDLYCIAFDEFIVDNAAGEKYLKDEANKMRELWTTFRREGSAKQVRLYFCGNPYSIFNPYWNKNFFGIDVRLADIKPGSFIVGRNYVIDCAMPRPELIDWLINKGMYDPELDDEYQRYAFGGVNINDEHFEIHEKQPDGFKLKYIFRISRTYIGIFINDKNIEDNIGKYWCTELKEVSNNRKVLAVDFDNLIYGSQLLTYPQRLVLSSLKTAISSRRISYNSISTGYYIEQIYKLL